ncbi:MAG TPA: hypothetical protein VFT01_01465 [Homoserinimonas sp.]|nr:hypothetical protein [Homoserinimonas sp.]
MRRRAVASVAVAALVLLGTSACNFVAPQATTTSYEPSDGTATTVGDVKVLNALLITEDGEEANLIASVVNSSDSRVQLKLQYESGSEKVDKRFTIGAGEVQNLGDSGLDMVLQNIDAKPGDLFPIYLQYGDAEGKQLLVPVLDGTQPQYADLLP